MTRTRVYLEVGKTWTFACAVDHPGWARRGKGDEVALEALEDYRERYGLAVGAQPRGALQVIGTVPGTMTTDFGAPDATGPWDADQPTAQEVAAVLACWSAFDQAVGSASAELQKGPRGGGRDRDEVVDHVQESERTYARKIGVRLPPRTAWPEQRDQIAAALRAPQDTSWSPKYAARRIAWHVLDHAWEIEDKSLS